jgi:hypothetical protein
MLPQSDLDGLVLTEGTALDAFTGEEALNGKRLAPYDAFAIWMHYHRDRVGTQFGKPVS